MVSELKKKFFLFFCGGGGGGWVLRLGFFSKLIKKKSPKFHWEKIAGVPNMNGLHFLKNKVLQAMLSSSTLTFESKVVSEIRNHLDI